jgi:hypothetical protein
MKKEFIEYLESVGITGSLTKRVEEIHDFYNKVLGYQIDDIFISEYLNQDGSRYFDSLLLFSGDYFCEAKTFITEDDFDADVIRNEITYFTLQKTDFDIINDKITEKSRAVLTFNLPDGRYGELKASKENCLKLKEILLKYIKSNFAQG